MILLRAVAANLRPVTMPGDFFRARRNLVARVIASRERSLTIALEIERDGARWLSSPFHVDRYAFEQLFAERLRDRDPSLVVPECRCGECPTGTSSLG